MGTNFVPLQFNKIILQTNNNNITNPVLVKIILKNKNSKIHEYFLAKAFFHTLFTNLGFYNAFVEFCADNFSFWCNFPNTTEGKSEKPQNKRHQ